MSQSLLDFAYPLRRRRLILGCSVESRTPLQEFFYFKKNFASYTLNKNSKKKLILKKKIRVQSPFKFIFWGGREDTF